MTRLSVNINKIATIRNARGGNIPSVAEAAIKCQKFGAQGITVHPRPDERHIRYADVRELKPLVHTEFNIEGYPGEKFIDLVCLVKPNQVTLVPDPPEAITSNQGWDTIKHFKFLCDVVSTFQQHGIRVSLFTNTSVPLIEKAKETGADRIELYTEPYATNYANNREEAVSDFVMAANKAHEIGLGVNAGHDLNLYNLAFLHQKIPFLKEVSIGHALIADALYMGLETTIQKYLQQLHEA